MIKRLKEVRTYIAAALIALSIWFVARLILFGLLDTGYILAAAGILMAAAWACVAMMFWKKSRTAVRFVGRALAIILCLLLAVGSVGLQFVDQVVGDLARIPKVRKDMSLIVLQDSELQEIQDITAETVLGYDQNMNQDSRDEMMKVLEEKTSLQPRTVEYENVKAQISALYDGEVDVALLNESYRDLLLEENPDFNEETRVLYSMSFTQDQSNFSKKIDVESDSFLVMISGIDTYGEISTVSRSDVNILAAVDPDAGKILLISIPRDYYVPIIAGTSSTGGTSGNMDKLTHSGLFGAECTVRTVENLFDTEINYYVKVNFSGVVDIVDALGGITVQSDYAFEDFQVGANQLNGEQALAFARNRYAFEEGDRQRGKNQMKVIQGIVAKVSGFSVDYDYGSLLNAVIDNVEMNFSDQEIKELIQLQITKRPAWSVETISVTGSDARDYSYYYGSDLYVMYPDEDSVNTAKEKLREFMGTVQEEQE